MDTVPALTASLELQGRLEMRVLVRDNLKVVELRLHDIETGRDIVEKFLTPEKYPNIYQYSDNWARDCPGYTPKPGAPNEGYITDQRAANYWRIHLPLWQKIIFLENSLAELYPNMRTPKRPAKNAPHDKLFNHIELLRIRIRVYQHLTQ